jgi:hypothetical protein
MPIFIKPRELVCSERADSDADYYYKEFFDYIKIQEKEEGTQESRQQLIRFKRWITAYKVFSKKYHLKNFVSGNDIYVEAIHAQIFSVSEEIPRAPYLEILEEIPEEV